MVETHRDGLLGTKLPPQEWWGRTLDTQMYYTEARAYRVLDSQGDAGRRVYRIINLVDFAFPPVISLLMSAIIIASVQRLRGPQSRGMRLSLIPLVAGSLDYAENVCIFSLLATYPRRLPRVARIAGILTAMKTATYLLGLALTAGGGLGLALRWIMGAGQAGNAIVDELSDSVAFRKQP